MPASRTAAAPFRGPNGGGARGALMKRPEVRDVLAWLRLLVDPQDAAAVVRALARPPIGLRQVDLARVIQVARRRKLDLVVGLAAATESPQVPPEARERIHRFVELHRRASAELETLAPDVFLSRLIEHLGVAGSAASLLAPDEIAERRESMRALVAMAGELAGSGEQAGPGRARELARHLATALPQAELATEDDALAGPDGAEPAPEVLSALEPGDDQAARLQGIASLLREELLEGVERIGGRLGELRLDTDLDISHGVVRYLELLKVAALMQRPAGQELGEALADVNARLLAAATPLQREILETSTLDESLLAAERGGEAGAAAPLRSREELSLRAFLPRRGAGLALSASDIETYRSCPLRYKYARVLRIPTEQTVHQRFGIVVHQVLERHHSAGSATLPELLALLEAGWRRAGLGRDGYEGELLEKGRAALTRYHERLGESASQPVWFERPFSFRLGPHHLRGRVDRVDRLENGAGYELIDYKTSRAKAPEDLRDDVQLSLYALAAREDWQLESSRQAYYYVLDDEIVPVPCEGRDPDAVQEIVMAAGEGILAQDFEPTPSPAACAMCDYRIVCPVAAA